MNADCTGAYSLVRRSGHGALRCGLGGGGCRHFTALLLRVTFLFEIPADGASVGVLSLMFATGLVLEETMDSEEADGSLITVYNFLPIRVAWTYV